MMLMQIKGCAYAAISTYKGRRVQKQKKAAPDMKSDTAKNHIASIALAERIVKWQRKLLKVECILTDLHMQTWIHPQNFRRLWVSSITRPNE